MLWKPIVLNPDNQSVEISLPKAKVKVKSHALTITGDFKLQVAMNSKPIWEDGYDQDTMQIY